MALRWFVEYATRDDYGATLDTTSNPNPNPSPNPGATRNIESISNERSYCSLATNRPQLTPNP